MNINRSSILLLIALMSTACTSQVIQTVTPVVPVVTASTEAPKIPTATHECQHAESVVLDVRRLSDSKVILSISGLQPGESPFITYSTAQNGMGKRGEMSHFAIGADTQGNFTTDIVGLQPLAGQTTATWDIRIIHSHGVECTTITLP